MPLYAIKYWVVTHSLRGQNHKHWTKVLDINVIAVKWRSAGWASANTKKKVINFRVRGSELRG
jgi:hypothetical protein